MATPALIWKFGASFAATGITAGAFGAHALKARLPPPKIDSWMTAAQYATLNGVALLAISQHPKYGKTWPAVSIAAGTLLFSGSIFGLVLGGPRVLGPVTPLGGLGLIAGYIGLLI